MKSKRIIKIIFIFLTIFSIVYVSIKIYNHNQTASIDVFVSYSQNNKYKHLFYNEFSKNQIQFDKDNYNLIKLNCEVVNNSDEIITIYDFDVYNSDSFVIPINSVELESPSTLIPNNEFDFEFYIYVNKDLSHDEIIDLLKENSSKIKLRVDKNQKTFYLLCKYIE